MSDVSYTSSVNRSNHEIVEFTLLKHSITFGVARMIFEKKRLKYPLAYLAHIEIGEVYRNHGYGTKFIKILEQEAKKRGFKGLWLIANRVSETWWKKLGYKQFIFRGEPTLRFEKIINDKR